MKKLWKNFTGCIMVVTLIFGMAVIVSAASTQKSSGECGKNATWTYDKTTQTVIINGNGTIKKQKDWKKIEIKHITINKGITKIGDYAFDNLKKLETVTIPDTVTSIGDYAFCNTAINSVTIKASVKDIGENVFQDCKQLKTVNWYAKKIPGCTFLDCKKLSKINIKSNLKRIGYEAFSGTGIKTFTMPDSVISVGSNAFSYCKNLTSLTFSKNVKTIPSSVAETTKNLEKIVIKSGTQKISKNAFTHCGAREIIIPDSVTTIEKEAFSYAKNLKTIKIPDKINKIRDNTFEYCTGLETINIGKNITSIGESAFLDCSSLNSIVIPGNVKTIEYKAFENSGCKSVTIESGVTTIDYWAFHNCDKLKSISISETVTTLRPNALVDCDSLTEIKVSAANTNYASMNGCLLDKSQTTLLVVPAGNKGVFNIPASISKVEPIAFCGCSNITGITAANSKYFTSTDGILYNKSLTTLVSCPAGKTGTIDIPSTVIWIKESAFQQSKASHIIIPNSVTVIGYCAFEYCENLKSIEIPGSVKKVPNAAFWGCKNLKEVTINSGVKKIKRNAFHGCDKLQKIIIPTSVTKISKSAFKSIGGVTFYCEKSSYAMSFAVKHYYVDYKII